MNERKYELAPEYFEYRETRSRNNDYRYDFTVFTPTYNSSHTLHRVYKSLKNQTYRNFEWLVVDDGSTDETEILVMSWIKIADFPIRYLKKKNGGKHTAINIGVQNALGELFLIHDADDSCIPETLERFKYHWDSIPPSQKDEYSGITVLCVNSNGEVVGDRFPESPMDISPLNLREYGIAGEKWGFHKTDIFKEFPFPEFPGEKFVAEGLIWNRIAVKYKIRFVNEALRIYEYSPNGLSASILKIRVNSPIGATTYYRELSCLSVSFKLKAKALLNYIRFSFHRKSTLIQIFRETPYKMLTIFLIPMGLLIYVRDLIVLK